MLYRKFLDPTTDITFKKVFGDKKKKDILIRFLKDIIGRKEGEKIIDITIIDPNNHPEVPTAKLTIVDIKCIDERGIRYIIEMQVINQADFVDRCQYYNALEITRQLDRGDRYQKLMPVILVGVANFTLFNHNRYVSHHRILDIETHEHNLTFSEYHFLELSKFNKDIHELTSVIDQWAYFLKHASNFNEIPSELQTNKEIVQAFEILELGNFNKSELAQYDTLIDAYRLEVARTEDAHKEGREEGIRTRNIEIAKKLLKKDIAINEISELTDLPIELIQKIKE